VAKEEGITEEKIGAVQSVVMAISACSISSRAEIGSMLPDKQKKAFANFFESTRNNEVLDEKATRMIQVAAALAIGCPT